MRTRMVPRAGATRFGRAHRRLAAAGAAAYRRLPSESLIRAPRYASAIAADLLNSSIGADKEKDRTMAAFRRRIAPLAASILGAALLAACGNMASRQGEAPTPSQGGVAGGTLFPSYWVAEDILGRGIVDDSNVTLNFDDAGGMGGSSGCNVMGGNATATGDRLAISGIISTMRACAPALMEQERRYFDALGAAEHYVIDRDGFLLLDSKGEAAASRFRPAAARDGLVRGSVTYRERIALPPDARLALRIEDVSLADAPAEVIAEKTIAVAQQVPIPFAIKADPASLQPGRSYAIRATLSAGGEALFVTATRYAVFAPDWPEQVDMVLERAAP